MAADHNPFADEMAEYATSDESLATPMVVFLDGMPIPVMSVHYSQLATFPPKFSIGDPTEESDNIFSVWTQDDWSGGGLYGDLNESSDVQRFRYGTAETRYPKMLTLPSETVSYTIAGATSVARPLGDYQPDVTNLFWATFDTDICYWDTGTLAFIDAGDLTAEPVNKGVVFDDLLWIPLGDSGYDTFDGTNVVNDSSIKAISLVEWDDKLIALETNGQVSIWDRFGWSSPAELKLRGNRTPRSLVVWWDQNREPTVFVVTNRDVWAVDPLVPTLYRTGLHFPVHPDQGLGATAWRDDSMYVSVGVGVHQLSLGGVVSAMGLDSGTGLPSYLRGKIVDLEPEYNGLLALVQGIGTVDLGSDESLAPVMEETMIFDDSPVMPSASTSARSTLQRWTGLGWHTVWESPDASGVPSRVMVSEADDEYRIWWGYGTSMYSQKLRRTFHNPKQGAQLGIDRFALTASMQSGRFDANMGVFHKQGSHVECHFDPISTGTFDVFYQTNLTYPDWILLDSVAATGQRVMPFDPNGDGFAEGDLFHWIEFDYHLTSTDPLATPVLISVALKFVKIPISTRAWTFDVPLTFAEEWTGRGAREIKDQLDALASANNFITFKHQDRTYRVKLAQTQGVDATGNDLRGTRTVSLIELRLGDEELA